MRITSPTGKFTFAVLYVCLSLLLGVGTSAILGAAAGLLVMTAVLVAAVIVGVRTFRGTDEEPAPVRPLWKMTARPTWGWVLAALLLIQGVGTLAAVDRLGDSALWPGVSASCSPEPMPTRRSASLGADRTVAWALVLGCTSPDHRFNGSGQ